MARRFAKGLKSEKAEALWREYCAMQLSDEEKAEAYAEVERKVEQARRDGVYERVQQIAGTVKWESMWYQLRQEDW